MNSIITAILLALADIESSNNDWAVGKLGEVSKYQISKDNWSYYTHYEKFNPNEDSSLASCIAIVIINSNSYSYRINKGKDPRPKDIYAMWNVGYYKYKAYGYDLSKFSKEIQDRCQRFENLYNEYKNK